MALAAKRVNVEVNKAGLVDILGDAGSINVQGEDVKKLDIYANNQVLGVLQHGISCACSGNEEMDVFVVFDVATESISPLASILPDRIYATNAVYSSATQNIYLIGGTNASANFAAITELVLNADSSVSATALAAQLPKPDTCLLYTSRCV